MSARIVIPDGVLGKVLYKLPDHVTVTVDVTMLTGKLDVHLSPLCTHGQVVHALLRHIIEIYALVLRLLLASVKLRQPYDITYKCQKPVGILSDLLIEMLLLFLSYHAVFKQLGVA